MTGRSNQRVELTLHVFPDPIAPRANDHATTHVGRLGQFSGANYLLIPLRKIFVASRRDCSLWGRVRHRQGIKRAGHSSPATIYKSDICPTDSLVRSISG